MIMKAVYKVDKMNLVQFQINLAKKFKGWRITKDGRSGWQLKEKKPANENKTSLILSYDMCSMEYIVKYKDFSRRFRGSCEKVQAVIRADTEHYKRRDCNAKVK